MTGFQKKDAAMKERGKNGSIVKWVAALIAAACFAGCSPTGCIQGGVVDGNGYPIKGLQVTLTHEGTHQRFVTHTDSLGNYLYLFLPGGGYSLSASRSGYDDLAMTFDYMGGTVDLKRQVMANQSTVKVFTFEPPTLSPMAAVRPDIASRDVTVYLPPSYTEISHRRYPSIYFLHGNGQTHETFFKPYVWFSFNLQSIMDELSGERIDVIEWKEDLEEFIKAALSPATIAVINLDKESNRAKIYVHTNQRPLAIGRNGQNVRLASQLVGLELDILDLNELTGEDAKDAKLAIKEVEKLPVSEGARNALLEANLSQVGQLKGLSEEDFVSVGLDAEQAAEVVEIMKLVK